MKAYNKEQVTVLTWLFVCHIVIILVVEIDIVFCMNVRLKGPRKKRSLRSQCQRSMMTMKMMKREVGRLVLLNVVWCLCY
jgi:hypothetical protein